MDGNDDVIFVKNTNSKYIVPFPDYHKILPANSSGTAENFTSELVPSSQDRELEVLTSRTKKGEKVSLARFGFVYENIVLGCFLL